ncbi:MAG: hypothetical protein HC880_00635 [Bacteroidia bacterium]|nr:hypothetical protein [Bacteroidia bacterium]
MPNPNAKPGAGLRLIFDLFRLAAALVVVVNVYFYCYGFLRNLDYHWEVLDAQLVKLSTTLFARSGYTKFLALLLLLPTWMGNPERKKDTPSNMRLLGLFALGTVFYF